MKVICDIECERLEDPQRIWVIVARDVETNDVYVFNEPDKNPSAFREFAGSVRHWVFHNGIAYDFPVVERLVGPVIDPRTISDTLVLSRLLKYKLDDGEGHGLEAWGKRFGVPKSTFSDFSKWSDELVERCIIDTEVGLKLYQYLMQHMDKPEWKQAIETEHAMAWICLDMSLNGFKYDKAKADVLLQELEGRLSVLDKEILAAFPPKVRAVRDINPRLTRHGTISKANLPRAWTDYTKLHADCPFTLIELEPFNPGSPSQVVERLDKAGWQPTEKTKSGNSYKISEVNLATLPSSAPEGARLLVERLLIASRVRTLVEWASAYNPKDGRVHGTIVPIGTYTHRASHKNPNTGNVAAQKSIKYKGEKLNKLATELGGQMRNFWTCEPENYLVGTDAEGIQLRIFAHYVKDPLFTRALILGKKEDGTDPHSINAKLLQCTRDSAKTFIYAFLLGAGDAKIGEILGVGPGRGASAKRRYIEANPGLRRLKEEQIPRDAARGYCEGIDGRRIYCDSEHHMLAAYLQSGEAILMKHANVWWRKKLNDEKIWYKQVGWTHDEWITEVKSKEEGDYIGKLQTESIKVIGEQLKLNCPMSGAYHVGKTWLEIH